VQYVHLNEYIVYPFSLQIPVGIINAKCLFKRIVNSKIKIEHTHKKCFEGCPKSVGPKPTLTFILWRQNILLYVPQKKAIQIWNDMRLSINDDMILILGHYDDLTFKNI